MRDMWILFLGLAAIAAAGLLLAHAVLTLAAP